jgi:DNA-binding transcriptional LysR family regulator
MPRWHLHYFVAVAEELNFRRAAERLHLSQPPLSAQIRTLEEELKVRLFRRSHRGAELTAEGRIFLAHARAVLAAADTARQSALMARKGLVGTLRVGVLALSVMSPTLAPRLSRHFCDFRRKYPAVQLFIDELSTAEQLQRFQKDQLDVGIMRKPLGSLGLESVFIEEHSIILAVPNHHHFARRPRIRWVDFRNEPMVMLHPSLQFGFYDEFLGNCAKAGGTPFGCHYANNFDTLHWLVAAGLGMTLTPNTRQRRSGITLRELPHGLPPVQAALVWKQSNKSPALANFLKCFTSK